MAHQQTIGIKEPTGRHRERPQLNAVRLIMTWKHWSKSEIDSSQTTTTTLRESSVKVGETQRSVCVCCACSCFSYEYLFIGFNLSDFVGRRHSANRSGYTIRKLNGTQFDFWCSTLVHCAGSGAYIHVQNRASSSGYLHFQLRSYGYGTQQITNQTAWIEIIKCAREVWSKISLSKVIKQNVLTKQIKHKNRRKKKR